MVMRDKNGIKGKQHCRVNMIKEQRISIYEHRIFAVCFYFLQIYSRLLHFCHTRLVYSLKLTRSKTLLLCARYTFNSSQKVPLFNMQMLYIGRGCPTIYLAGVFQAWKKLHNGNLPARQTLSNIPELPAVGPLLKFIKIDCSEEIASEWIKHKPSKE